jgi:hypothetical protein
MMRLTLRSTRQLDRHYLITAEDADGNLLESETAVCGPSWDEALLWWLSGYDADAYAAYVDVEIEFNTSVPQRVEVWASGWLITVRDVTDVVDSTPDCITVDNLFRAAKDRRDAARAERKAKQTAADAEQSKADKVAAALRKLQQLQSTVAGLAVDAEADADEEITDDYVHDTEAEADADNEEINEG